MVSVMDRFNVILEYFYNKMPPLQAAGYLSKLYVNLTVACCGELEPTRLKDSCETVDI